MLDRIRRLLARQPPSPGPLSEVTLQPIGVVRNRIEQPRPFGWRDVSSRIILRPDIADALLGLSDYSHIIVLSWLHAIPEEIRGSKHRLHPLDDPELPLQGVLATRSQIRFNPVAFSVVLLEGIDENVLRVRGLDAIDGTPVLDVKPYIPQVDAVPDARVPAWVEGIAQRRREG